MLNFANILQFLEVKTKEIKRGVKEVVKAIRKGATG